MSLENNNSERTQRYVKEGRDLNAKSMSPDVRSSDYGKGMNSLLDEAYTLKVLEVNKELEKLELNEHQMQAYQKTIIGGLQGRLVFLTGISADLGAKKSGTDIGTSAGLSQMQIDQGIELIRQANVQTLVCEALPPELQKKYEEKIGHEVPKDDFKLLERIVKEQKLSPEDWERILFHARPNQSTKNQERNFGIILISKLTPKNRTELLERMKDDPDFPQILTAMVENDYVKPFQAADVLDREIANLKSAKNPDKKTEERLKNLTDLQDRILSPDMLRTTAQKAKQRAIFIEDRARYIKSGRQYGHRNSAKDLLTWRGVGSTLLTVNGICTVIANVAVDPGNMLINPGTYFGLAQTLVGLQGTKGLGGLIKTPIDAAKGLTKDTLREKDEEVKNKIEGMQEALEANPLILRLYLTFAKKISDKYKEKVRNEHNQSPRISLEDIGVDHNKLPNRLKLFNKQEIEKTISDWAKGLSSLHHTDEASQTEFIQKAHKEKSGTTAQIEPLDAKSLTLETPIKPA